MLAQLENLVGCTNLNGSGCLAGTEVRWETFIGEEIEKKIVKKIQKCNIKQAAA